MRPEYLLFALFALLACALVFFFVRAVAGRRRAAITVALLAALFAALGGALAIWIAPALRSIAR